MSSEEASPLEAHFADLYGFFTSVVDHDTRHLTLLDFGCGRTGYVSLYREHFGRSLGLDVVDYARNYDANIEFILSNGRDIPLPDRSVDVVVSHSTLEHVEDVELTVGELNRVLVEGGYAYLTVAPLYFSQGGGHLRAAPGAGRLTNWEHLDPESPHYRGVDSDAARLQRRPQRRQLDLLNQLTTTRFLAAVGAQPWDILTYRIKAQHDRPLPGFLCASALSRVDLYTKEFRLIARKSFSIVGDRVLPAAPLRRG
jgi:SAM-dependent methyltransferase